MAGWVFWALVARHTSTTQVGTATATLGLVSLLALACTLGLPNTFVRFLARDPDPRRLLTSGLWATALAGFATGTIWAAVYPFTPALDTITSRSVVVFGVVVSALGMLGTFALVAQRRAAWVLSKDTAGSVVKLGTVAVLWRFGALGVIAATFIGTALGTVVAIGSALRSRYAPAPSRPRAPSSNGNSAPKWYWTRHLRFSLGNHLSVVVASLPALVLPAVVATVLGANDAAYVAVALMLLAALNIIPQALSNAMLAEIGHDETQVRRHVLRALAAIYAGAVPAALVLYVLAPRVLTLFGERYSQHATTCLRWMCVATLISGLNYVGDTVLLAFKRVRAYGVVNIAGTVLVLASIVVFANNSTSGIGLGWLCGQVGYLLISLLGLWRSGVVARLLAR